MNESDFAAKIVTRLNESLGQLDGPIVRRLAGARARAITLAREADRPMGWEGDVLVWGRGNRAPGVSWLLIVLALLFVLTGFFYWERIQQQRGGDFAEIDAKLLADELPIDVYLDNGFDVWLRQSSE